MALHLRAQLRSAIAAALKNTRTAGHNVLPGREWPTDEKAYPGLLVYARGGASGFDAMSGTDAEVTLERDEKIVVEGIVRGTGGDGGGEKAGAIDDLLDALAAEVEPAMMSDAGIAALVDRRELIDTAIDGMVGGDTRLGSIRLVYRFVFATAAGDPTAKV
jgi:hypothetical protein